MFTFRPGSAMSRQMKSYARRAANTEYVDANGTNPVSAIPAAAPNSSCSAIPIWKYRCGKAWAKMCMSVYLPRSAVSPTIRSSACAAWTSACPNGAGVVFWPGSANDAIIAEVRRGAAVLMLVRFLCSLR